MIILKIVYNYESIEKKGLTTLYKYENLMKMIQILYLYNACKHKSDICFLTSYIKCEFLFIQTNTID